MITVQVNIEKKIKREKNSKPPLKKNLQINLKIKKEKRKKNKFLKHLENISIDHRTDNKSCVLYRIGLGYKSSFDSTNCGVELSPLYFY